MQTNSPVTTSSSGDAIRKSGPILGSASSIIGASLGLIGFVLPWASCGGYQLSGLDIATQATRYGADSSSTLLCFLPLFALGALGVAIVFIPASFLTRLTGGFKAGAQVLVALLTLLACCPACLFFYSVQASRNDPRSMGLGGFVRIEYGFWVTVFGLLIALAGAVVGFVTAMIKEQPLGTVPALVPPASSPTSQILCSNCGNMNSSSARFCLKCGNALK